MRLHRVTFLFAAAILAVGSSVASAQRLPMVRVRRRAARCAGQANATGALCGLCLSASSA